MIKVQIPNKPAIDIQILKVIGSELEDVMELSDNDDIKEKLKEAEQAITQNSDEIQKGAAEKLKLKFKS